MKHLTSFDKISEKQELMLITGGVGGGHNKKKKKRKNRKRGFKYMSDKTDTVKNDVFLI